MSDFNLVDIRGWEYDLQSVYTAYMGYFQQHSIPWYDRTWGHLFNTFEDFLSFSWPVITITDALTGRAHIVTRMSSIGAFLKMIKTRFGETLPLVDNMLKVDAFETHQRHSRTVSDYATYKKLHATLPAAVLAALKVRVRNGDPRAIRDMWQRKDKSYLAIDFECSERNASSVLEWGYAALRCGHLDTLGAWPPVPDDNYRKGHYIVSEYVDKIRNRNTPNYPWQYAFGESQIVPKAKLPQIIQAVISSMASPDSETFVNNLVIVTQSATEDLRRMEEMKIKIPHNVVVLDINAFEKSLFRAGKRGVMLDAKTGQPRQPNSTIPLSSLLLSLNFPVDYALHNSGNDAFACLLAFQKLLDPEGTRAPPLRIRTTGRSGNFNPAAASMPFSVGLVPMSMPILTPPIMSSPLLRPHSTSPHARTPDDYFDRDELSANRSRRSTQQLVAPSPDAGSRSLRATDTGSRRISMTVSTADEQGRMTRVSSGEFPDTKMRNTLG